MRIFVSRRVSGEPTALDEDAPGTAADSTARGSSTRNVEPRPGPSLAARTVAETLTLKPRTRIPVAARDISYDDVVSIARARAGMSPGKQVLLTTGFGVGAFLLIGIAIVASSGF